LVPNFLHSLEYVLYRAAFAVIDTSAAKDALNVLHSPLPDHVLDGKAHGTIFRTPSAINTYFRICSESQGRQFNCIRNFPAQYHKRRHPANMMAERTPADNKSRHDNQKQHGKISYQGIDITDRKTESGLITNVFSFLPLGSAATGRQSPAGDS